MKYVTRIHLKTGTRDRARLIDFCLKSDKQYIAIGWPCKQYDSFNEYYKGVKEKRKKIPSVLNIFRDAKEDDLFWTRDLDGCYWICRVTGRPEAYYDEPLGIGAVIPVQAYCIGMQVPGQIKAAFNRPRGGTSQRICDKQIVEYSKFIFNNMHINKNFYPVEQVEKNLLENLPDFDLEELVIIYLQIKEDFYVLSNSIANKSTTIKIECELMSRICPKRKAVVQVKGGKSKQINASNYKQYVDKGYLVYLYAPEVFNTEHIENVIHISQEEILNFYKEYKLLLPDSITKWENLCASASQETCYV